MDHDVFACECHETCSICCEPYRLSQLKPHTFHEPGLPPDTWEMVCPECRAS